jgi:hypothetical protein
VRRSTPHLPYFVGAFRFLESKAHVNDQGFAQAL